MLQTLNFPWVTRILAFCLLEGLNLIETYVALFPSKISHYELPHIFKSLKYLHKNKRNHLTLDESDFFIQFKVNIDFYLI